MKRLTWQAWRDLYSRYVTVWRAAWQVRAELEGPKRSATEAEFLPAALALQERPAAAAPRVLAYVLMLFLVLVLLWACFGKVDVVAVATGRVVVSDKTKVIQPLENAVVQKIYVRDGERVKRGQALIDLDATLVQADASRLVEERTVTQNERERTQFLLTALDGKRLPAQAGVDVWAEWADIQAKRARLTAEEQRKQAEIKTAEALLAKLKATLPIVEQRAKDYQDLVAKNFVSAHGYQDRERERIEMERDLAAQQARMLELQAGLRESLEASRAFMAETRRALLDRQTAADLKLRQLEQEQVKTQQRQRLLTLTAPVDGVVQQLAIHTTSGVVTEAQPLMVIVPDGAQVIAEVVVENKDIGFVNPKQLATIKLETFPYTKYGTLEAQVTWVAADAVLDDKRGPIFPATLALQQAHLMVEGKRIALAPGMSLTAEIKTGKRRIIEYFLSPLIQHTSESLRER